MKLNLDFLYQKDDLLSELEKLRGINKAVLSGDTILLLKNKRNENSKVLRLVSALPVKVHTVDSVEYIQLNNIVELEQLSRKTKRDDEDDDHLLGDAE